MLSNKSKSKKMLLEHLLFLFDRTYQLLKDRLACCLLTPRMFCQREKANVLIIIQQNDKSTQRLKKCHTKLEYW